LENGKAVKTAGSIPDPAKSHTHPADARSRSSFVLALKCKLKKSVNTKLTNAEGRHWFVATAAVH